MKETTTLVTPTQPPEASFDSLRASLKMFNEYYAKKDYVRACILSKQVSGIKAEMLAKADESYRSALDWHIEYIILNG
jgi:hypothetical protein